MNKLIAIAIILMMGLGANAQSPDNFTYQSVIRNSSGNLVTNQNIGMRVSILQGSATGTDVLIETHNTSSNGNGLVTISIGAGSNVSGSIAGIDWGNGPYFLKVEVDPTGGTNYTISGATQIHSVPYASHAGTAEKMSTARSVLLAAKTTDAAMTTSTGTIAMQTTLAVVGSNISLSGSDILLKKGHIYRCSATLHVTLSTSNSFTWFKWYNNSTSSWIGAPGSIVSDNRNYNEGQAPRALAYINLTNASADETIRLRHYGGATYSTIWGSSNQTYCECFQID